MNFLGGARGSKRLISQNPLLKIVSKKYGLMLRTVENKIEIIILSLFVGKKLEFSKNFNIFVILAYELHNRILILEKFDDFFFDFLFFFEKFWMIPNDKYIWEGQIVILSFVTCSLHMKSTIKLNF